MKVFISWSGTRSKVVAELLREWIKCVLQATRPWISTRDIDRGALWFTEISDQLKETSVGVVCLTQENRTKPWILFEAGALAKGLSTNRVCTFLVDLSATDIEDPLAQFNHTTPNKEGMWNLLCTLNSALGTSGLDQQILDEVFETYSPKFQEKFQKALKDTPNTTKVEPRKDSDILVELLESTRALASRMARLEQSRNSKLLQTSEFEELENNLLFSKSDAILEAERLYASGMGEFHVRTELRKLGIHDGAAAQIAYETKSRRKTKQGKKDA